MAGEGPTDSFDGSSMATPHVTGVVGHLLAKHPTMRITDIKARVVDTGDSVTALEGKTVSGKRLNLDQALTDGSLNGTVTADDGGALANVCVTAWSEPDGSYSKTTRTGGDGVYAMALPHGDYTVQFRPCDETAEFAAEWHADVADWADATPVTVAAGGATVDASLSPAGGITGTATSVGVTAGSTTAGIDVALS